MRKRERENPDHGDTEEAPHLPGDGSKGWLGKLLGGMSPDLNLSGVEIS
jgi:hypothetical protein